MKLTVDGEVIHKKENSSTGWGWCQGDDFDYEFYNTNIFTPKKLHSVVFQDHWDVGRSMRMGAGTIFLYNN